MLFMKPHNTRKGQIANVQTCQETTLTLEGLPSPSSRDCQNGWLNHLSEPGCPFSARSRYSKKCTGTPRRVVQANFFINLLDKTFVDESRALIVSFHIGYLILYALLFSSWPILLLVCFSCNFCRLDPVMLSGAPLRVGTALSATASYGRIRPVTLLEGEYWVFGIWLEGRHPCNQDGYGIHEEAPYSYERSISKC